MLDLKTVEIDEVPKPGRGGNKKNADKKLQIQEQLRQGKGTLIENVEVGNPYNNLQQLIRQAGKEIGVKVTVVFQKHDNGKTGDVYFKERDND